jgi:predicted site-specific integrase-resolvase
MLDTLAVNVHTSAMSRSYSTAEVAAVLGVSKKTLLRWLWAGKLPEPERVTVGHIDNRIWRQEDMRRAKEYRKENYRKRPAK